MTRTLASLGPGSGTRRTWTLERGRPDRRGYAPMSKERTIQIFFAVAPETDL